MATARLTIGVKDGLGLRAATDAYMNIPDTATLAQVEQELGTASTAFVGLFTNATQGQVIYATLHIGLNLAGLTTSAAANSRVGDGAMLSFPVSGNGRTWGFEIPAVNPACIVANGPDLTDGNTLDLLADLMEAAMPSANGLTGGYFSSNQFLELIPTANGFLNDRKHRRAQHSRTVRVGA